MKSKKVVLIILVVFANSVCLIGQEFKSGLFFNDSNGERDTVYIGYDSSATIQVDTQFGELDISENPLSQGLDIRLSQTDVREFDYSYDIWDSSMLTGMITYESKVDILPRQCQEYDNGETIEGWPPHSTLLIPIKNLPLTMTWDSTMFESDCLSSSFLTLWPVNTWWDTQSFQEVDPSSPLINRVTKFTEIDELIIEKQMGHRYITEQNDTMMMLFIVLNDNAGWLSKVEDIPTEKMDYFIYPNPCKESVNIEPIVSNGDQKYKLFSLSGAKVKEGLISNGKIDISNIEIGIYFIQLEDKGGKVSSYKVTKI